MSMDPKILVEVDGESDITRWGSNGSLTAIVNLIKNLPFKVDVLGRFDSFKGKTEDEIREILDEYNIDRYYNVGDIIQSRLYNVDIAKFLNDKGLVKYYDILFFNSHTSPAVLGNRVAPNCNKLILMCHSDVYSNNIIRYYSREYFTKLMHFPNCMMLLVSRDHYESFCKVIKYEQDYPGTTPNVDYVCPGVDDTYYGVEGFRAYAAGTVCRLSIDKRSRESIMIIDKITREMNKPGFVVGKIRNQQYYDENKEYIDEIYNVIKENPLIKWMEYLPNEEVCKLLGDTDMFVSACDCESFGNTIVEAMMQGTPVLSVNHGGAKYLVQNGINGYLAETFRSRERYNKFVDRTYPYYKDILNLINDTDAHKRIRDTVKDEYSIKAYVTRMLKMFDKVLSM